MKLITFTSTIARSGRTTIGTYAAVELAKTGKLVLYIEACNKHAKSPYLHRKLGESQRTLTNVLYDPPCIWQNIIQSPYSRNLFYLCNNFFETVISYQTRPTTGWGEILKLAEKKFDYVILDIPSDFNDPVVGTILSPSFAFKPVHNIMLLDEDALSFRTLEDFNEIVLNYGVEPIPTTFVINKDGLTSLDDYISPYLISLKITQPINIIRFPYVEYMPKACNEGDLYGISFTGKLNAWHSKIHTLVDIITNDKTGINLTEDAIKVGAELKQKYFGDNTLILNTEKKKQGFFSRLFKKKEMLNEATEQDNNESTDELDSCNIDVSNPVSNYDTLTQDSDTESEENVGELGKVPTKEDNLTSEDLFVKPKFSTRKQENITTPFKYIQEEEEEPNLGEDTLDEDTLDEEYTLKEDILEEDTLEEDTLEEDTLEEDLSDDSLYNSNLETELHKMLAKPQRATTTSNLLNLSITGDELVEDEDAELELDETSQAPIQNALKNMVIKKESTQAPKGGLVEAFKTTYKEVVKNEIESGKVKLNPEETSTDEEREHLEDGTEIVYGESVEEEGLPKALLNATPEEIAAYYQLEELINGMGGE